MGEETQLPTRWGQERRLEFIEFRLQWEGKINRADLVNYFSISVPQASLDFARYREMAPTNTIYDVVQKAYTASPSFAPVFGPASADAFLTRLWATTTGTTSADSSFLGWKPPAVVVRDPARSVDTGTLKVFLVALREKRIVLIEYQSMTTASPSLRKISPHAMGFDGFRWHVRAFCHTHNDYRDFVLGRIRSASSEGLTTASGEDDQEWHRLIEAVIIPHPNLSQSQRETIEADYCMEHGRLVLRVREALLLYHLDHLGLVDQKENRRKHIALENHTELLPFFKRRQILPA